MALTGSQVLELSVPVMLSKTEVSLKRTTFPSAAGAGYGHGPQVSYGRYHDCTSCVVELSYPENGNVPESERRGSVFGHRRAHMREK